MRGGWTNGAGESVGVRSGTRRQGDGLPTLFLRTMPSRALEVLEDRRSTTAAASRGLTADRLPQEALDARSVAGAYVHVPFCAHKCHYCDFYSFVDRDDRQAAFVQRLIEEWEVVGRRWTLPLETIFVGGGTPTLLAPSLWRDLLRARRDLLPLVPGGEFTVEANPETVTPELVETLVDGGVTRVSLGVQSFEPRHLATLERWHAPESVPRAVDLLRRGGLSEINLDLIFGIPGQSLDEWRADLRRALELGPDHLSAYGLTYEPNTPMSRRLLAGEFRSCPEDLEASMFELAMDQLETSGFHHYEISNWGRRDGLGTRRCCHNMLYWTNRDWWAFGPSASGHVQGVRWKNVPRLGEWLNASPWSPVTEVEQVDERTRSGERLMMGLRLLEGIDELEAERLLGCGPDSAQRSAAVARCEASGLLDRRCGRLRLTRRGTLLANVVMESVV